MVIKRIAINALTLGSGHSGARTYLINLMEAMTNAADRGFKFYILIPKCSANLFREKLNMSNAELVIFPNFASKPIFRFFIEQLFLPLWLKLKKINLLFARNIIPLLSPCSNVNGVLSMHLNYEQENISWWRRIYGPLILKLSAKRADAFVAISEYAGRTYIEKYHVAPEKLFVAPCGLSSEIKSSGIIAPNPFDSEYLLFVSTLFPHKNVAFLIRTFAELLKLYPNIKLIIVGRGDKREYIRISKELNIDDKVVFTGGVSTEKLIQYYQHARLFVFPSLIEGFGLTPLEAMAHSIPVVVSDRTSIPEVVGDGGIVLSPDDEILWAEAILEILQNDEYHRELSIRAKARSEIYTWQRAAEITLKSFEYVLNGNLHRDKG